MSVVASIHLQHSPHERSEKAEKNKQHSAWLLNFTTACVGKKGKARSTSCITGMAFCRGRNQERYLSPLHTDGLSPPHKHKIHHKEYKTHHPIYALTKTIIPNTFQLPPCGTVWKVGNPPLCSGEPDKGGDKTSDMGKSLYIYLSTFWREGDRRSDLTWEKVYISTFWEIL